MEKTRLLASSSLVWAKRLYQGWWHGRDV